MSLNNVPLNSQFDEYYYDMMVAYEIHHIPPHEFRKISAMDWKIIKAFSKAMKVACSKDKRILKELPSTKGLL